jgi:ABC-2 type transport system permease protein
MTFLNKLLGKNYKWWYLISYEFKRSSGHFYSSIFNTSVRAIEFLAIVFIWKLNGNNSQIISYLALGRVFGRLLTFDISGQVSYFIVKGDLTRLLLLPSYPLNYFLASNIGFNFIRGLINALVTLALAILFFGKDIQFSLNILLLFPFFFLSYLLGLYFSYLIGCIAFWARTNANSTSIIDAFRMLAGLLSGEIIPLFLIFSSFYSPFFWTPFAFLLHHPMQIYLGKYDFNQTVFVFAGGISWCIILYFLAKWIFKIGLKRNEAVGL